jgi:flavin reductase (DIM6/NTAB) family NADH-FMN oxidoreductase RutF
MRTFTPNDIPLKDVHHILLSGVAPRPIALVGTISNDGIVNLSPFSFFNAFSSNPPVVAFGPSHRATDGAAKDTYTNLVETKVCTISAVTFAMVQQTNLSSATYPPDVDEFVKAGFTRRPSLNIAPPSVAESPFSMECELLQMIDLAPEQQGGGNLAICKVVRFHVSSSIFEGNHISPQRFDLVGRMGMSWYTRASGDSLFPLPQPQWQGIGFDALPPHIRHSTILTGNDLAKLAGVKEIPKRDLNFPKFDRIMHPEDFTMEIHTGDAFAALYTLLNAPQKNYEKLRENLHKVAQLLLEQNHIDDAWQVLLLPV